MCFVEIIAEVYQHHADLDPSLVARMAGRARLWFWVPGADAEGIIDCLGPAGDELFRPFR